MSLPLSFYKSTVAGSFAARGAEAPGVTAVPMTATQQIASNFMAPAKKEFSAVAFLKDLAIVSFVSEYALPQTSQREIECTGDTCDITSRISVIFRCRGS